MIEPLEPFVTSENVKPVPLPPVAVKSSAARGAELPAPPVMETPAPTVTLAEVLLPSPSVTLTTSLPLPIAPAL